jgi:hypothetical protein
VTKFVSVAKLGVCSKRLILNKTFLIFGSRFRLDSLLDASIFLLFFFFAKRRVRALASSSSSKVLKMEPLSPIAGEPGFAYASDIAEDNSCEPGHVVELSF